MFRSSFLLLDNVETYTLMNIKTCSFPNFIALPQSTHFKIVNFLTIKHYFFVLNCKILFVGLVAFGLFHPSKVYGTFLPFIIAFTIVYMATLYTGSIVDKFVFGGNMQSMADKPLADSGISWFPYHATHHQVRFFKLVVIFTLFCSVMKATKGKTAALEEQTMEQAFRKLFQDNFRLYFRYFDMYRLATNLITFCLCYIKQDILHAPLLIFGLMTSTSRNGTSGIFFEYLWSTYSWYFVFVIIFVNVCTLPSLVPSLSR